jgi:hypothetical protein
MNHTNKNIPYIPVSIGELLDKITILKIKNLKIKNESQLQSINTELSLLNKIIAELEIDLDPTYKEYVYILYEINNALWNIEDNIRNLENKKQFDDIFIETARMVYKLNDKRAEIKKQINHQYQSIIIEEKSYHE